MKHKDRGKVESNEIMTPDSTSKELKSPARNTPNLNATLKVSDASQFIAVYAFFQSRAHKLKLAFIC